jgi:hypothetical protein
MRTPAVIQVTSRSDNLEGGAERKGRKAAFLAAEIDEGGEERNYNPATADFLRKLKVGF